MKSKKFFPILNFKYNMTIKRIRRKIDKLFKNTLLKLSKRQRFVITTFILTLFIILTQSFNISKVFILIGISAFASYIFVIWCLWEELDGIEFITLTILPVVFTIGISLFYFLLPYRMIVRAPVITTYAIGIYAILSLENIFNVAAIRTIALLRAAKTFNMIFSVISIFFLFNTFLSLHYYFIVNFFLVFAICYLVYIPLLWCERLNPKIDQDILIYSYILSLIIAEFSLLLSFYPINPTFESLFLASQFYVLLGIAQYKIKEAPLRRSIFEYLLLTILSLLLVFNTPAWQI